ncbi:MDR family MFS transporter [Kitasatospora sp. NPDC056783]|uniref:MDR family MFS transporter n=1 Tax=Kitasatospora sp. NPDC056783 TaxID=3345943 RepID=UPI003697EDEB
MLVTARFRRMIQETAGGLPRQFWWLWVSTLVNRLGAFVVPFLSLYLTSNRGYSVTYAGVVAALFGLGAAVSSIVAGVLTDRIGRRPTLLAAQLGTALFTAVLGFSDGQVTIAVVAFLVGFFNNATRPAVSAIIADIVPSADRVRAYSLNFWAINLGFGLSSAVAGLIATHGYLTLFLLDAVSTALCAVVIFVRIPETKPDTPATKTDEPAVGLGGVFRDRRFMAVVGLTLLLALVMQQGSTTLPVDMGLQGVTPTEYGLVIGLNGLLIVLLQIPLTRWVENRSRSAMLAAASLFIGWGFGMTALAGSSAWFYAFTVAVWTIGEILYTPTLMSLIAELSPTHARGRYQGVYSLSWSLASFVGPAVGGVLLERAGGGALWGACGVCGTVAAAGYLALGKRTGAAPGVRPGGAVVAVPAPTTAAATAVAPEPAPKPEQAATGA